MPGSGTLVVATVQSPLMLAIPPEAVDTNPVPAKNSDPNPFDAVMPDAPATSGIAPELSKIKADVKTRSDSPHVAPALVEKLNAEIVE